jgi:pantoate--beta-alanine ligase
VSLAVFERISQIHSWVISQRDQGHTIGFVPTMGALHAGHQSLIELATGHCDRVVASVFVNPTQFNNAEDLKKYPRTLEADLALLEKSGCHAVFCPSIDEMYEPGEQTQRWDFGALSNSLEGEFRPGHFDGVLTIVKKLFLAVEPNKAFFGEKDFQQLAIIKRMTEVEKLPIEIIAGPTIRENNGLAMSSRNTRLSEDEKIIALHISRVLLESARSGKNTDPVQLENQANADLKAIDGLRLEYCSLVNASDFEPLTQWPTEKTVLLVAAFVGEVRLIDNVIIP